MLLLVLSAFATDSGIQRIFDREVECAYDIDPKPDPDSCFTRVRKAPPTDERPTWAITVAAPGKLFLSYHMPDVDWGTVHMVRTRRSFDPILLSVGLLPHEACDGKMMEFAHLQSERDSVTHQACSAPGWTGVSEVLLESHRRLPKQKWIPIWVHRPTDAALASKVKNWFIVQIYISTDGSQPETPAHHPYASVELLHAWVPKPLPRRVRRSVPVEAAAP